MATVGSIGSNLDVNAIVTQLMTVEQRPLTLLSTKEASYQARLSAWGSIKSAVSSFQSAMSALASTDKFNTAKASVGDATIVTANAGSKAAPGRYALEVQSLAQAQKLKSGNYAKTSDTLGSGTLTIQFGRYEDGAFTANGDKAAQTVVIAPGSSSLAGVRDAINAANVGVTASIVNDGNGNRLVIGSKDSGADNALRISVADDDGDDTDVAGLSALAYDAGADGVTNLNETVTAQNATVVIDGITVSKGSNTITDAIEGVTLNLLKAASGTPTTLTVARDNTGAKTAVDGFIKAYNDLYQTLARLSAYDASTKTAATLQGDSTVRTMQTRLRTLMSGALDGAGGGLRRMSDIGVSIQTDGTLKLDATRLQKVLDDPTKDVATLFASIAKPSDSLVSFAEAATDATAGTHALTITQLATQGNATGSLAATTTISAGVNDTLTLKIDGVAATITLGAGSYTAQTLAAELQSRINGAAPLAAAGVAVNVTQSAGVLTMTSNRWGSASKVDITGGNGAAGLFGSTTSSDGVDVAGTLGGVTATGSGQKLSALGISLVVDGGSLGSRGTVGYARGFADQFADMAKTFLADGGLLDGRTASLNRAIADLDQQRNQINTRLDTIEQRYRAQFTALDAMLSSMQSTSDFLTQQLAALPKISQ